MDCPNGGSCNGSFLVNDIYAKFGWWECTSETSEPSYSRCSGQYENCLGASNIHLSGKYYDTTSTPHLDLAYDVSLNASKCKEGTLNPPSLNPRCKTCALGYVRVHAESACTLCLNGAWSLAGPIIIIFFSFLFLFVLVALKVRSSGSKKAPHSVMRRTLLHHLQTLGIIMSMHVTWPKDVLQIMSTVGSVATTSDHLAAIKCALITFNQDENVNINVSDASFSYVTLVVFANFIFFGILFAYFYWICFAPIGGKCCRCGGKYSKRRSEQM